MEQESAVVIGGWGAELISAYTATILSRGLGLATSLDFSSPCFDIKNLIKTSLIRSINN